MLIIRKITNGNPNFSWIYIVIFLAIPLARIIPRLLAKRGIGKSFIQPQQEKPFEPSFVKPAQEPQTNSFEPRIDSSKLRQNIILFWVP